MNLEKIKRLNNIAPLKLGLSNKKRFLMEYLNLQNPGTYFTNGELQCYNGRNRSFIDLYYITKAEFKSTTKKQVAKILYDLCTEPHDYYRMIFCSTICEVVFFTKEMHHRYDNMLKPGYSPGTLREYRNKKTISGVTINGFLKLAGKYE